MEKLTMAKFESVSNHFCSIFELYISADDTRFFRVHCYEQKTGGQSFEVHTFRIDTLADLKEAYMAAMAQHIKNIVDFC